MTGLLKLGVTYLDLIYTNESLWEVFAGVLYYYIYLKYFFLIPLLLIIYMIIKESLNDKNTFNKLYKITFLTSLVVSLILSVYLTLSSNESISYAPTISSLLTGLLIKYIKIFRIGNRN